MDLAAIATALKTTLDTLDAEVYDRVPGNAVTPAIVCYPKSPISYRNESFSGQAVQFAVWCLLGEGDYVTSQETILDWLGISTPNSVFDLIAADATLGGVVADAAVIDCTIYGVQPWLNGTNYFQAELTIDIYTT